MSDVRTGNLLPFEYVVLRVVPRVDRGESVNGAVALYCQQAGYFKVRVRGDLAAVTALDAGCELEAISALLEALAMAASGVGPTGGMGVGARFRWLAAPRSSTIQPGPIHTGLTSDPEAELDRLESLLL